MAGVGEAIVRGSVGTLVLQKDADSFTASPRTQSQIFADRGTETENGQEGVRVNESLITRIR